MDVVSLASELVRIGSVNPAGQEVKNNTFGEAAMGGRIKSLLRTTGATNVETTYPLSGRPNVIGYFDFGAEQTLLFEAHMDTVSTVGMTVEPFGGEVRDGKLWGRGASDVKGPMAAMLKSIEEAKTRKGAKYNVLFAAVCDEEAGFSGVRHLLENLRPELRDRIAFAVVAEPTELQPLAGHKGAARWTITSKGLAAHSSTPELGRNAIYSMAEVVLRLREHADELQLRAGHDKLGLPTLSVGTIAGGSAVNIVPDSCVLQVDRRLVPPETPESAREEIVRILETINDVEVSSATVAAPAFLVTEDSLAVESCITAAKSAGVTSQPRYAKYCTDASFYQQHGIEAVVFGPGSITQAHTADEWITIEALHQGVAAYLGLLV